MTHQTIVNTFKL